MGLSLRGAAALSFSSALVSLATGCLPAGRAERAKLTDASGLPAEGELAAETDLALHGMVVFGQRGQYMYHLPMWWSPHAWHLVLEVALDQPGQALYQRELEDRGHELVTFYPRMFPLSAVVPGFAMSGELYHGHFEQGGTELPSAEHPRVVSAVVRRIVALAPLEQEAEAQAGARYRVFGAGGEWYATHIPVRAPDYDQVVKLDPVEGLVSEAELAAGFTVTSSSPPIPASDGGARVGDVIEGTLPGGKAARLRVTRVEYFSTGDLGM